MIYSPRNETLPTNDEPISCLFLNMAKHQMNIEQIIPHCCRLVAHRMNVLIYHETRIGDESFIDPDFCNDDFIDRDDENTYADPDYEDDFVDPDYDDEPDWDDDEYENMVTLMAQTNHCLSHIISAHYMVVCRTCDLNLCMQNLHEKEMDYHE